MRAKPRIRRAGDVTHVLQQDRYRHAKWSLQLGATIFADHLRRQTYEQELVGDLFDGVTDFILDVGNALLDVAFGLLALAFVLGLVVAGELANAFFDIAGNLVACAVDTIFIAVAHDISPYA